MSTAALIFSIFVIAAGGAAAVAYFLHVNPRSNHR